MLKMNFKRVAELLHDIRINPENMQKNLWEISSEEGMDEELFLQIFNNADILPHCTDMQVELVIVSLTIVHRIPYDVPEKYFASLMSRPYSKDVLAEFFLTQIMIGR